VGLNPTSGEELAEDAWFIPHTETANNMITTYNVIPALTKEIWLNGILPKSYIKAKRMKLRRKKN
jgi:hypothetical protein